MKTIYKILVAALIIQTLASCDAIKNFGANKKTELTTVDYLEKAPKIDVKNFFSGDLDGFAIIRDTQGLINDSFTLKVNGAWEGNRGTIRYNYVYNGGKKDSRTWLITINDSTNFSAIGHDFVQTAQGLNQGNSAAVNYGLTTLFEEQKQRIDFEDHLYLVDENSAIVISTMKKGGSIIGKTIISLKKIN